MKLVSASRSITTLPLSTPCGLTQQAHTRAHTPRNFFNNTPKTSSVEVSVCILTVSDPDVQFWETGPWAPPPSNFKFSQLVVIKVVGGKKGPE
jgi:hypothetical protein